MKKVSKMGRPPKLKEILKAKDLKKKGLTYRDVMKLMNEKDVKTIFRWVNYDMMKLAKVDKSLLTSWQK